MITLLLITSICLSLMAQSLFIELVKADVIDDAILLSQSFLDRAYHEVDPTHAVCKEYPSMPFRVYDETHGYWIPLSKESADVQSIARFKGGCKVEHIKIGHAFTGGDCNERWYKWDCDNNGDYDDLVLWCEDTSASNTHIWMHVAVKNNPSATFDLYLGDIKIIDNCKYNDGYSTLKHRGWFSQRYTLRHATRLMQWYYEDRGNTARANRLENAMDDAEYTLEFYAPLWGKSNSYQDSPYIVEAMYPDPEKSSNWIWSNQAIPYSSHLSNSHSRDSWLNWLVPRSNPLYTIMEATHLINKYPSNPTKIAEAKAKIDSIEWDGYGVRGTSILPKFQTPAYATYTTASYGYVCGRYYQLTDNTEYRDIFEDVMGVLLKLQLTDGKTIWIPQFGNYYRADSIGAFLGSYIYDNTFDHKGLSHNFIVKWGISSLSAIGWCQYDQDEYQAPIVTNTETTLICWKTLKLCQALGLTPNAKQTIEDFNGQIEGSWSVARSHVTPSIIVKAYRNGYVEMRLPAHISRCWVTATLCYPFTPEHTTLDIDVGMWYLLYYLPNPTLPRFGRLRLFAWIRDTTTSTEVWNNYPNGIQLYYNDYLLSEIKQYAHNYTLSPTNTFNPSHNYELYLKFDMDTYNTEIDCANIQTTPIPQPTRIKLEVFSING